MQSAKRCIQNDSLLKLLECPICMEQIPPRSFSARMGMSFAVPVNPQIRRCPSCQVADLSVRNLQIERLAETIERPCRYQVNGCDKTLPYLKESEHADDCKFRPLHCPHPNCQSTCMTRRELASHLKDAHDHVFVSDGSVTMSNPSGLRAGLTWHSLLKHANRYYRLCVDISEAACEV